MEAIISEVKVSANSVEFPSICLTNPEVVAYFQSLDEDLRYEQFKKTIEIGASVFARVDTSSDLDFVNARLSDTLHSVDQYFHDLSQQMKQLLDLNLNPARPESYLAQANHLIALQSKQIKESMLDSLYSTQEILAKETAKIEQGQLALDRKMDPTNTSSYLSNIVQQIDGFEQKLSLQFNDTDSASFVGRLRTIVNEHFGQDGEVLKLLDDKLRVDLEGATPLGTIYHGLKGEIASLRDVVMKMVGQQELIQETTKKGFPFEKIVFDKLSQIAKPYSDIVEDTSLKVEAISGSKKGDYVYTLAGTTTNIVIDAKNYGKLKSLPAMLNYLKEARRERNAKIGIIVAPDISSLQKQIGEWNVYGSYIITPLDYLEISIKYAKFALQLQSTESDDINLGIVMQKLDAIKRKMKDFSSIKSKLTKMSNGVTTSIIDLQKILDSLREDINSQLLDIETEFAKNIGRGKS